MLGSVRQVAKQAALGVLGSGFAVRRKLAAIGASGAVTILNLHRVAPHDDSAWPPLEPALFDQLLAFVQDKFELVTFSTLDAPGTGRRPRAILSFDDGYRDFYDHAAPLLAKRGIRVNHNIVPASVESGQPPLNVIVADFVGRAPARLVEQLQVPGFTVGRLGSRAELGHRLAHFLKEKPIAEQRALAGPLREQMLRDPDFIPTPMMTLEQVREMAEEHEIGAHSFEHANMAFESGDYLRDDVDRCREWFAHRLGRPLTIYALPNGSYRPEQLAILRAAGIEHVLLVDEDFSSPDTRVHKRFTFDGNSVPEMRFRATGAFRRPA